MVAQYYLYGLLIGYHITLKLIPERSITIFCWSKFSLAASLLFASILVFLKLEHVMHDQLFHYRLHILCVTGPNIVITSLRVIPTMTFQNSDSVICSNRLLQASQRPQNEN